MNRDSTSSGTSVVQRNYIRVSETQTELAKARPNEADTWSAYLDSYAGQIVELRNIEVTKDE